MNEWAGHVACMGEGRGICRLLVGKHGGKRPLGKHGVDGQIILRWILRKLGCGGMDWIKLAQDRDRWWALVNAVMHLRVPSYAVSFLTS
jgi:hypothetical protein